MRVLIILLFLTASFTFAQRLNITTLDEQVNAYLFNGQWEKSDSLIELQLSRDPGSLKYNFMKAYNIYYARYFSNTADDRATTLARVKHYTWEAIKAGEQLDESLENNFYMG